MASSLFHRIKRGSFRSKKNGITTEGVVFPDGRRMVIPYEEDLTVQRVIDKACMKFEDYFIPPCVRPFLALCPEGAPARCLSPYQVLSQEDCHQGYHMRVMAFIKETHRHITRLDCNVGATRFYFDQVHQDFLLGRFTKLESKDNISAAFMMAALDVWKWALKEKLQDTAVILKKITLSHFLPQSILQRVPRPKDCLEHYFNLLRDKWRPDQVMSETKCMQNYLRLFEENLQPDIHKFTVKVSQQSIDGSVEQDEVPVEMSAYSGIKIKRANQQYFTDLCPLNSLQYIEAISSHSMVRVAYEIRASGHRESHREIQALNFVTTEELVTFCTLANALFMLVVNANKCLLEGSLKPCDEHLKPSPGDPVMMDICHLQICRVGTEELLMKEELGSFLLRQSRSEDHQYDLCVRSEHDIKNVRIAHMDSRGFCITEEHFFPSLTQLIKHYHNHRGMPARLQWNYCPSQVSTPIPNISSKEWKFEPVASEEERPVSDLPLHNEWGAEWRESVSISENSPSAVELEASAPMEPSEISFAFIKMGSPIGEGHFSLVHKGTYTPGAGQAPICVAIKELKDTGGERALMMEARNMSQLDHSHIVKFYGFCRPDHRLMLVTEFVQGGDLLHLLRRSSSVGRVMTLATQLRYSSQVANGMSYLAEKSIVHRDLAARNVLVSEQGVVKITDFGLARSIEDKPYYRMCIVNGQSIALPLMWYAPECLCEFKFTSHSDIWSYGILLWEIFSLGGEPYYNCPPINAKIYEALEQGQRLPQPQGCPDSIYEMMLQCWTFHPDDRPDFVHLALFTQRRSEDY